MHIYAIIITNISSVLNFSVNKKIMDHSATNRIKHLKLLELINDYIFKLMLEIIVLNDL
jgi:hypothetical protein